MSESQMWSHLREKLGTRWDADRIEDKLNLGVADVAFACGGYHGWMELKQIKAWPVRDSTAVRIPHFTQEQKNWLRRKGDAGYRTWLLLNVKSARHDWLLFPWYSVADIGRLSKYELVKLARMHWERGLNVDELLYQLGQE